MLSNSWAEEGEDITPVAHLIPRVLVDLCEQQERQPVVLGRQKRQVPLRIRHVQFGGQRERVAPLAELGRPLLPPGGRVAGCSSDTRRLERCHQPPLVVGEQSGGGLRVTQQQSAHQVRWRTDRAVSTHTRLITNTQ